MVETTVVLAWAQIVVLAASLPLAAISALGYRTAPVGTAVAALPFVSFGFLLAASADLIGVPLGGGVTLWHVGITVGGLAMGWVALSYFAVVSGWRRIGR